MIENIIIDYLADHKRVVVPEFGAFIKKEADGKIVFVPFLNKDDGILINLIRNNYDVDKEQAATIIKEYTTQIKRSLAQNRKYIINRIGALKLDANDTIYLDILEATAPATKAPSCSGSATAPSTRPMQTWEQVGSKPSCTTPPSVPTSQPQSPTRASIPPPVTTAQRPPQMPAEGRQPQPCGQTSARTQPLQTPPSATAQRTTASTTMPPRPAPTQASTSAEHKHTGELERQGKVDMFLVVAIIAALIAIAAILYGYMADSDSGINLHEQTETEIVVDQPTESQK